MADNRVSIRTSDILEKLAAIRAARIAEVQQHAYRIDPGMKLARQLYLNDLKGSIPNWGPTIEDVLTRFVDVVTPIINAMPDRTMPPEKSRELFAPPTTEMVLDAFDIWAGMQ